MKKTFIIVTIIFFTIMCVLVHSRFVATKGLITKEYTIINNNLSEGFNGLKILHFSDILYSQITNSKDINKIVEETLILKPDIVIFSGDLIESNYKLKVSDKEYLIEILKQIPSNYGKYATIGDSDYGDLATVNDIYLNSGFMVLDNEYDIVYNSDNEAIFIGGLNSSIKKQADIDAVMNYFNNNSNIDYKIMIIHEGDYIDNILPKYDIDLILAGHSLNGQINIPLIKNVLLQEEAKKYYDNYYKLDNADIYISSGIGVTKTNFRLFNKPSINFYRLKSE